MTVNLLIRSVSEEVCDALAARARGRHQSMQAYLHELMATEARHSKNSDLLTRVRATGGGITDSASSDTVTALAQLRSEHDAELARRLDHT